MGRTKGKPRDRGMSRAAAPVLTGERTRPNGRQTDRSDRTSSVGKPPEGKANRRRIIGWLIAVLAVAVLGGVGWRLRQRPAVSPNPTASGPPVSAEEAALQRQAAQNARDPEPWRKLGGYYLLHNQPFEAVWAVEEALERAPGDVPTLLRLSEALETAPLYRPALEPLTEVLRRAPDNLEARERMARLYRQLGEGQPAIAAVQGAGKRLGSWSEGLLELGLARQLDGDLPGAIAVFRRHLEVAPGSAEGSIRLARALLEQGQLDPARRVLQHGRLSAPHDPRFPFYLGLSYLQEGHPQDPKSAMGYFKEALAVAPQHPLPHHYMGLLLARQGRWPEAQVHFLQATKADPTYPEPQLQFARSLEKTGDHARAKEQLGVYYFLTDNAYQAAEAFRGMVKADPNNVQAPRLVSLAYLNLGRNDWAIRETKAALRQHPGDETLLERLATLYIMTHSRGAARQTCQEWLNLHPNAPRAHWLLGRIAKDDLRLPEAIREYETAIAAEPGNADYATDLAAALQDVGGTANLRRAAELLRTAVKLDPGNPTYHRDLGMALQELGDLEGARRELLAALDRNPRHAPAYSGISQLCARLRRPALGRFFAPLVRWAQDRSREELQLTRRISRDPISPEAHFAYAAFLMRHAAFPTAQSHLERALALRPGYPAARAALAKVKRVISVR